ncbi:hypothetical protein Tco_1292918 [Tanacetum coccineum]
MNNRQEHHTRAYLSPIEDSKASNVLPSNHRGCSRLEGYKVKDAKKPILETFLKKGDDLEATCLFSDAALRTSLLYVMNNRREHHLRAYLSPAVDCWASNVLSRNRRGCSRLKDENIMRVHIYLRWRIAGLGMFSRETIEGAQGYKVNNINEAILEAILKKHGGLEATCVFSDAALRTSLLYVVAQGYKVKEANKAILEAILKKHDDENIMHVHIYLRWRIAGLGMFSRETIEGAQGYKVNNINEAILEAILKKHGGLEATCVFSDAALRTSLLYVVYELLY